MSHLFESGFTVREGAWHGLAKVVSEPPTSAEEAMRLAGCDWQVKKETMFLGNGVPVDGHFATVRVSDNSVLGVVGERYNILQNTEAFSWFNPLIDSGLVTFESAGSLNLGRRTFVQAKIKDGEQDVIKGDTILAYLLLSNSHDGSLAIDVRFSPVRVVCNNTLTAALNRDVDPHLTLKHTRYSKETLETLRETVNVAARAFDMSIEQYRYLASKNVKGLERDYVRRVFGTDTENEYRYEDDVIELMHNGMGNQYGKGTFWAAYNGCTEFIDHVRGRDNTRLEQSWFGIGKQLRQKAMDLALEYATAA